MRGHTLVLPGELVARTSFERVDDHARATAEGADQVERPVTPNAEESLFEHARHSALVAFRAGSDAAADDHARARFQRLALPHLSQPARPTVSSCGGVDRDLVSRRRDEQGIDLLVYVGRSLAASHVHERTEPGFVV